MEEVGTVRDMSSSGVYFILGHDLKPETKLELDIRLKVDGTPQGSVLFRSAATVVRVEDQESERYGIAARIDQYSFLHPGDVESPSG